MIKYLDKVRIVPGCIYETRNSKGRLRKYSTIERAIEHACLYKNQELIEIHIINPIAKNILPDGPTPIARDIKDIYCVDISDRWIYINPEKSQIVFETFDYDNIEERYGRYFLFDYDILYNDNIRLPQIGDYIISRLYKDFDNRIIEVDSLPLHPNKYIYTTRDTILYNFPIDRDGSYDVIIAYSHAEIDTIDHIIPYYSMRFCDPYKSKTYYINKDKFLKMVNSTGIYEDNSIKIFADDDPTWALEKDVKTGYSYSVQAVINSDDDTISVTLKPWNILKEG